MSHSVNVSPEARAKDAAFLQERAASGKEKYIVRHSKQARLTHGITVIACILLAISGLFVFVPQLAQAVGADTVFVIRMSHRVLGFIFVLVPLISAIMAPKGVAHIFKNLFAKWNSDDKKWMLLFFPYLFMAKWIHMPDQDEVKSGQRFADGMLWVAGAQLDGMTCMQLFVNRLRSRRRVPQVFCGSCSARSFQRDESGNQLWILITSIWP